ncbi:MAG TPA: flagellar hook-basal body complex protein [Stellaceae bacterium]|nr:flagellar hook-basal body complex protein [Stellaceae bacterium]
MSGITSAFNAAVAGIQTQSSALNAISDNIANASTTGYKAIQTSFQTLVATAPGGFSYNSGGVTSKPVQTVTTQGTVTSTGIETNLAIQGNGLFAVSQANTVSATGATTFSGQTLYSRAGDFSVNSQGYLVNSAGYYLDGWSINQTTGTADKNSLAPIQITQLTDSPQPTTTVAYSANLPSNPASSLNVNTSQTTGIQFAPTETTVYDSLGAPHTVDFNWTKVSGNNDTWTMSYSSPDTNITFPNNTPTTTVSSTNASTGAVTTTTLSAPMTVVFNVAANSTTGEQAGSILSIDQGQGAGPVTGTLGTAATIPLDVSFGSTAPTSDNITVSFGNYGVASGLTQFTGTDIASVSTTQNGLPPGSFSNLTIDQYGKVTLNYDNGASRSVYEVPVAKFSDENSLQQEAGDAYATTTTSGSASYETAGSNGTGTLTPQSVESSNSDISSEFTKMIQTQRAYDANSKTLTTANEMLQTLEQIIH